MVNFHSPKNHTKMIKNSYEKWLTRKNIKAKKALKMSLENSEKNSSDV